MTLTEMLNKYTNANVDTLLLGYTDRNARANVNDAVVVAVPMIALTEDVWNILTNGTDSFRTTTKSKRFLKDCYEVARVSMEYLESLEGTNLGFKAETLVFGSPNYSESLIDGVWHGHNCQMKTSFTKGNGTSRSHAF